MLNLDMCRPKEVELHLCTWSIPNHVYRLCFRECQRTKRRFIYRWFPWYHQILIVKVNRHKAMFVIEWGSFQYIFMSFVLNNAPIVFTCVVVETFKEFIHKILEVCHDCWNVFSLVENHVEVLWLMLDQCIQMHISLN